MVRIKYRKLVRLLDLIDDKIVSLEKERSNENQRIRDIPAFGLTETGEKKEIVREEFKSRLDPIIQDYSELRQELSSELDSIDFEFGVGKWNQNQNQNKQ